MSEQLHRSKEKTHEKDLLVDVAHELKLDEKHESTTAEASHNHQKKIETIRRSIEKSAEKAESLKIDNSETNDHDNKPHFVSSSMQTHTLNQSLRVIRRNLSPTEKQFSRLIHNQAVDQLSEVTAKTVARPSGLLVGGIAAFCSSITVMIICRYFGFEYNYFVSIATFVIGFVLGLIFEGLYVLIHHKR